jgi:hypothetical protein
MIVFLFTCCYFILKLRNHHLIHVIKKLRIGFSNALCPINDHFALSGDSRNGGCHGYPVVIMRIHLAPFHLSPPDDNLIAINPDIST